MGSYVSRPVTAKPVTTDELMMIIGIGAVGVACVGALAFCVDVMEKEGKKLYETQKVVSEYMAFHYCPLDEYVGYTFGPHNSLDFPKKCIDLCLKHKPMGILNRALDIGCSVGRSTFELARAYDEVVGMDLSQAFVEKCNELKNNGQANYTMTVEGDLVEHKTALVDATINRSRTSFMVGDACNIPDIGKFGLVFAGNLICRLSQPMMFFNRLPGLVVPGGLLVLTSPYTWLESYTHKSHWIGGFQSEGVEVRGFDTLKRVLGLHFELVAEQDIAFVIRETVRKHQWTVSHVTVWRRK